MKCQESSQDIPNKRKQHARLMRIMTKVSTVRRDDMTLGSLDLNSDYNCASAHVDVPRIQAELERLADIPSTSLNKEDEEERNHLNNQLSFIKNKCGLR